METNLPYLSRQKDSLMRRKLNYKLNYDQPNGTAPEPKISQNVDTFKNIYVHERRLIERVQKGSSHYKPSPRLDGKSRFDTPEEIVAVNEWVKAYNALTAKIPELDPKLYLRVLFKLLRRSDIPVPTVQQVGHIKYVDLVRDYIKEQKNQILSEFRSEVQRANIAVTINEKGAGYPFTLSVYYALLDHNLDLSPLFKYCLAQTTVDHLKAKQKCDSHCEKLEKLATQWELLAALDYTVSAADYDAIWGVAIPIEFKNKAFTLLERALAL